MAGFEEQLERWNVESPRSVVRLLAEHRKGRTSRDQPIPVVTLYLGEGLSFTGQVVEVKEDRSSHEELVLLRCRDGSPAADDVALLPLASVRALRIHDGSRVGPLFTGDRWPAPPGQPCPSRLELKRLLEAQSQELKDAGIDLRLEVDWATVPAGDEPNPTIQTCLLDAVRLVREMGRDDMGRNALRPWAAVILAHAGVERPELRPAGRTLRLSVNLDRALPIEYSSDLARQLDAIL